MTELKSIISLVDGMHFQGKDKYGNITEMDSRPAGVVPDGPTPMELVLQALCGCSGMDIVFILRKRQLEPELFTIEIDGVKQDNHPRIFKEINVIYRAKGEGINQRELERAASLSMEKYCSVSAMLKNVVKIKWKCEVIE